MSSSTPTPRFLLDENVRSELARFLRSRGFDIKIVPRSSPDSHIASESKKEKRTLVTNDVDFCRYSSEDIFSVIWLKIPQNDPHSLLSSFTDLISKESDFAGRLIILRKGVWETRPLGSWVDL